MSVPLPAWDNSLAFQLWSLDFNLSTKNWKSETLLPFNLNSKPRYLLGFLNRLTWKELANESCSSSGILEEQNRSDLARLMFCPDKLQYHCKILWIFWRDLLSFLKKSKESSAKNRCVKVHPFLPTLIPWIALLCSTFKRAMDSTLAHNKNR